MSAATRNGDAVETKVLIDDGVVQLGHSAQCNVDDQPVNTILRGRRRNAVSLCVVCLFVGILLCIAFWQDVSPVDVSERQAPEYGNNSTTGSTDSSRRGVWYEYVAAWTGYETVTVKILHNSRNYRNRHDLNDVTLE